MWTQFDTRAANALHDLAQQHPEFTSDALAASLRRRAVWTTRDRRRIGKVMRVGQRERWIIKTEEFRASARAKHHGGPKRVWRSLIYRAPVGKVSAMPLFTGEPEPCAATI